MASDSITDEIRSIRRALAERCGNNVLKILAEVREREAADGRTYVMLPKRSAREVMAEQVVAVERRSGASLDGESTPAAH